MRLAQKAFYPGKVPFPLVHVDTGHNFPETITFRDWLVESTGLDLIVANVQDDIDAKRVTEEKGKYASRNTLQTVTLLRVIEENKFDACLGGARRDEENRFAIRRPERVALVVWVRGELLEAAAIGADEPEIGSAAIGLEVGRYMGRYPIFIAPAEEANCPLWGDRSEHLYPAIPRIGRAKSNSALQK